MPTQTIDLNNTTPAAPAEATNVQWQSDPPSLDPTVVRKVSAYLPTMAGDSGAGGQSGLVPAPAAGDAAAGKFLKADGAFELPPIVVEFDISSGLAGVNIAGVGRAPRAGKTTECVVTVIASDAAANLVFQIKKNGASIWAAAPQVNAGTAAGTQVTLALDGGFLAIAKGDIFEMDITTGSASWSFLAQLE